MNKKKEPNLTIKEKQELREAIEDFGRLMYRRGHVEDYGEWTLADQEELDQVMDTFGKYIMKDGKLV